MTPSQARVYLDDGGALLHPPVQLKSRLGFHDVDGQSIAAQAAGFGQQDAEARAVQAVDGLSLPHAHTHTAVVVGS